MLNDGHAGSFAGLGVSVVVDALCHLGLAGGSAPGLEVTSPDRPDEGVSDSHADPLPDRDDLDAGVASPLPDVGLVLVTTDASEEIDVGPPTVVAVEITSSDALCAERDEVHFVATAVMSDGSRRDVTSDVEWASSLLAVWGNEPGAAVCLIWGNIDYLGLPRWRDREDRFRLFQITSATRFYFDLPTLFRVGQTRSFQLLADSSPGHPLIVKNVTWESSNSAAVKLTSFGDYGQANAVGPGTAQVTAKLGKWS